MPPITLLLQSVELVQSYAGCKSRTVQKLHGERRPLNDSRVVLVVDDDLKALKLIARYCDKLGLVVREAMSAKAAERVLEQLTPDLICLDLILPDSSGFMLCEKIRSTPRLADVPVLVISARASLSDRAAAEEAGANDYLTKPLRWEAFATAASRLLGASGAPPT